MKKFAVYSKVKLIKYPDWFSEAKGDFSRDNCHITLKQACFIEDDQISDAKKRIKNLNKSLKIKNKKILIKFDKLFIDTERANGKKTIMIRAIGNEAINKLQKEIVAALKGYNNYCEEESKKWERYFHPHITIANNLNEKECMKIKKIMGRDIVCEGLLGSITLVVEDEIGKRNRTNYKFL